MFGEDGVTRGEGVKKLQGRVKAQLFGMASEMVSVILVVSSDSANLCKKV